MMTWQSRNAVLLYVIVGRAWLASRGERSAGEGGGGLNTAVAFHENANTNI